jgi:hypothetical protein
MKPHTTTATCRDCRVDIDISEKHTEYTTDFVVLCRRCYFYEYFKNDGHNGWKIMAFLKDKSIEGYHYKKNKNLKNETKDEST